ncbi:MAG: hypothetical protein R3324_19520 [Halobacteriales archaeon]|nr:hypothetical protein [Halobacteriales archaeon]
MALLSLLVRWVHVLSMALLLGGAVSVWWMFRTAPTDALGLRIAAAAAYERLFWLGLGLLVATGVGNLGAMAPAIPTSGPWAEMFVGKLGLVIVLVVLSLGRSLGLNRVQSGSRSVRRVRPIRHAYAMTAILLVGIVAVAEVLAHG